MTKTDKVLCAAKVHGKTGSTSFLITGGLFLLLAIIMPNRLFFLISGLILLACGSYFTWIKPNDTLIIYDNSVQIKTKNKERVIKKKDIVSIDYQEIKSTKGPAVVKYPVFYLKHDENVIVTVLCDDKTNLELQRVLLTYLAE